MCVTKASKISIHLYATICNVDVYIFGLYEWLNVCMCIRKYTDIQLLPSAVLRKMFFRYYYNYLTLAVKYLLSYLFLHYNSYRVYGQSMAIEESVIGGRTIKVQKTIWTLAQ